MITRLSIANYTRSSYEVPLAVVSDDETVLSKTYDIESRTSAGLGGQVIDADLPTEPSEIVIRAEVPKETAQANLVEQHEEACSRVIVLIERNATLSILSSGEGTECFGGTATDTLR